jgi:PPOX class probable F420-dependent enzyme
MMESTVKEILHKNSDLFSKRAFAQLATLMPDGSPQVSSVWVDYVDGFIWINSARGRQKECNIQRDPRVAIAIQDPDNPYRKLLIRGKVIEVTEKGADDHIDKLAKKYRGVEKYPNRRPGEVRVIFKIKPEHVTQ